MNKEKALIILDRCLEFLLYLMIFFMPISKAAIEIIFTLSFFLFVFKKILKPDFEFLKNPIHFFLLLFFGFCALSLSNSGIYFAKGLKTLFSKWLENILIFILVEDTLNTPKRLRNAVSIFLATSVLIGIDTIFQQNRGIDFLRQRPLVAGRPTASFENQNSLGTYLIPGTLLAIILIFSQQLKKQYRYILFFLAGFLSISLMLTFSRSAWFGFAVGLFLFLFLSLDIKKAFILICIFIVILISVPMLRQRVLHTFVPHGDAQRFALIFSTWNMIKDNPFLGKGLGTYMDYFRKYATIPGIYYAHNDYLQIWAESGIFSLLSFLLFIGSILYKAIEIFIKNRDILLLGFICLMAGFLAHNFFEIQLYSLQLSALFWFMLGLLAAK